MYTNAANESLRILEENNSEIKKILAKLDDDDRDYIIEEIADRIQTIIENNETSSYLDIDE